MIFEMDFDHAQGKVQYHYLKSGNQKSMEILPQSQDRLSLAYYFRTLEVTPGQIVEIPTNTEQQNWKIRIKTFSVQPMKLKSVGRFEALAIEPQVDFVTTLKEPGSLRAWISMDERRIPLKLKAKAPWIGSISAVLTAYEPGTDQA